MENLPDQRGDGSGYSQLLRLTQTHIKQVVETHESFEKGFEANFPVREGPSAKNTENTKTHFSFYLRFRSRA